MQLITKNFLLKIHGGQTTTTNTTTTVCTPQQTYTSNGTPPTTTYNCTFTNTQTTTTVSPAPAPAPAPTPGVCPTGVVCSSLNAPETTVAESSGGDGGSPCVICTQLTRTGNMDISTWSAAQRYGNERFSAQVMNGYHAWGVPYVKLMRKSPMFAAIAKRPVNWFAEDLAYRMGVRAKPNYMGWALRELAFRPVCWSIGVFAKARDFQHLWTGRGAMA